jgi:hypothetical protein
VCLAPALPLAAVRDITYVSPGLDVLLGYEVISQSLHKSLSIDEKSACILSGRCGCFLALDFDIDSWGHARDMRLFGQHYLVARRLHTNCMEYPKAGVVDGISPSAR